MANADKNTTEATDEKAFDFDATMISLAEFFLHIFTGEADKITPEMTNQARKLQVLANGIVRNHDQVADKNVGKVTRIHDKRGRSAEEKTEEVSAASVLKNLFK